MSGAAQQSAGPTGAGAAAATSAASRGPPPRQPPPPRIELGSTQGEGSGGLNAAEAKVRSAADRLAGQAQCVDILINNLQRALAHPHDEKYRTVNPKNPAFASTVGATPGGVEFLLAVGYEPLHGRLVLQQRDDALLWLGKAELERVRATSSAYLSSKERTQISTALDLSRKEHENDASARRAQFARRVPDEPAEGAAGNALICVHFESGTGLEKGLEKTATVWRRFESCCTLEDLFNFARSLPGCPEGDISLTNVTMMPHKPLSASTQMGLTLQALDLWPTGHVKVAPASGGSA